MKRYKKIKKLNKKLNKHENKKFPSHRENHENYKKGI